jgi:hypothetical protein
MHARAYASARVHACHGSRTCIRADVDVRVYVRVIILPMSAHDVRVYIHMYVRINRYGSRIRIRTRAYTYTRACALYTADSDQFFSDDKRFKATFTQTEFFAIVNLLVLV